jgi:3-oxoacyl-[acyl-carrier protein] reductase
MDGEMPQTGTAGNDRRGEDRPLDGRVAIVTGAGQGIGRAFARTLAEAGASTVVADISGERAEAVAAEIRASGYRASCAALDVGDARSVTDMADRVLDERGQIDILINNAALFSSLKMRRFEDIPLNEWDSVLRVNITGVFLCSRAVVPAMRRAGFGRIVNITSAAVLMGRPNYLHYIASKSALIGMTNSLAHELGSDGITVNAIAPGAIFTEVPRETVTDEQRQRIVASQCIPRSGGVDDLLSTLLYLVSPATGFVTGQTLVVDGGVVHG